MITKIQLENLDICGWMVNKFDLDISPGLNIIEPNYCEFIISIFKHIISCCNDWYRRDYLLGKLKPINKNDLIYITLHCTYKDSIIKYSSTYVDNKIFTETISLDDRLIGYMDYTEETLEKGILYWDTLGGLANFEMIKTDAKLLCNTMAGKIITNSIKNYIICDTSSSADMSNAAISGRLSYGGKDRIPMLNKLYPILGFDVEIDGKYLVHPVGNKMGVPIIQEGSGFHHLLEILPKLMYCKENNLNLIIPLYDATLHYLTIKRFKKFLEGCGVNIIASSYDVD